MMTPAGYFCVSSRPFTLQNLPKLAAFWPVGYGEKQREQT
jgi:hypothetical protein